VFIHIFKEPSFTSFLHFILFAAHEGVFLAKPRPCLTKRAAVEVPSRCWPGLAPLSPSSSEGDYQLRVALDPLTVDLVHDS